MVIHNNTRVNKKSQSHHVCCFATLLFILLSGIISTLYIKIHTLEEKINTLVSSKNGGTISSLEDNLSPMALDTPSPDPLPSIRLSSEENHMASKIRKFYGGAGDKLHLGKLLLYFECFVSVKLMICNVILLSCNCAIVGLINIQVDLLSMIEWEYPITHSIS
jgi:hypothetical protein